MEEKKRMVFDESSSSSCGGAAFGSERSLDGCASTALLLLAAVERFSVLRPVLDSESSELGMQLPSSRFN